MPRLRHLAAIDGCANMHMCMYVCMCLQHWVNVGEDKKWRRPLISAHYKILWSRLKGIKRDGAQLHLMTTTTTTIATKQNNHNYSNKATRNKDTRVKLATTRCCTHIHIQLNIQTHTHILYIYLYSLQQKPAPEPTASAASPRHCSEVFATIRCCNSFHTYIRTPLEKMHWMLVQHRGIFDRRSCCNVVPSIRFCTSWRFYCFLPHFLCLPWIALLLLLFFSLMIVWLQQCSVARLGWWRRRSLLLCCSCCCCYRSRWWWCCRSLLLKQACLLLMLMSLLLQRVFHAYSYSSRLLWLLLLLPSIGFAYWHFKWLQLQQYARSRQQRLVASRRHWADNAVTMAMKSD